jgi:acyl-CoA thioesterase FadM
MQYDARKIRLPDQSGSPMEPIRVQEYHLDTNRHVNNGQYVRMAAGFLPPHTEVSVLRIEYRQQALLGDIIQPVVYTRSEENTGLTAGRADAAAVGNTDGSNTRPMPAEDSRSGAAQTVCIALNAKDGRPYAILEAIF